MLNVDAELLAQKLGTNQALCARAVYAMGFYMDEKAAKHTCDSDFSCLPPTSLQHNQALAESIDHPSSKPALPAPLHASARCYFELAATCIAWYCVICRSLKLAVMHPQTLIGLGKATKPVSPVSPLNLCIETRTFPAGVKTAHDIEKSVRIVVTSGLVNQERFSKGLRESLEPRLRTVSSFPSKFWHACQ